MATSTEEILLRLGLDATAVKTGMAQANASVQGGLKSIASSFSRAFAGGAILAGINSVINKFDDLKDRADNLGISTDFLQGMNQIASRDAVGGVETFNKSISELSVRLGSAKDGSEQSIKAFEKFGITLKDIQTLDAEGMMYLIADKIKAIPDPAQRAAAAFELLGKAGKNMTGILSGGADELKRMVDAVDKLDAAKVAELANAKDEIDNAKNTLTVGAGRALGATSYAAKWWMDKAVEISLGIETAVGSEVQKNFEARKRNEDEIQKKKLAHIEEIKAKEAAANQAAIVLDPRFDVLGALLSAVLIWIEMQARSRRHHSGLADAMIYQAVEQFLPAGAASVLFAFMLWKFAPDTLWMLPGLWQILVSLGIFASVRSLARTVAFAGAWYFVAGFVVLLLASQTHAL